MKDISLVTLLLIALNALISWQGFNNERFFNRYKFIVRDVKQGDYIRLLSSGFLHADWAHLIFNMLTLYFFADVIIYNLGNYVLIKIYLLSLISGGLFALYFHRNEPFYTAVGASGAVIGVLYAAIMLQPNMQIILLVFPMPAYLFGIGYLLYSIYGMRMRSDNIGHSAHFGGAVAGYAYTLIAYPSLFFENPLLVIALATPIVLLFVLNRNKKI